MDHPIGKYLLMVRQHVVAVIDGQYFDTWNCGSEIPDYYWIKEKFKMIYSINGIPCDSEFLAHYGVVGMKWGVQHGPPYPINSAVRDRMETIKKKRVERATVQKQKRHDKAMNSRDPKVIYKNRDALSDKELQEKIYRLNLENQVKLYADKNVSLGEKILKRLFSANDDLSDTVVDAVKKGSKSYITKEVIELLKALEETVIVA